MPIGLGIDFGTSFSSVGIHKNGNTTYAHTFLGTFTTPSIVYLQPDKDPIVGDGAECMRLEKPLQTIYEIKRFLGLAYNDKQLSGRDWSFEMVADDMDRACVRVNNTVMTPQQIAAIIIGEMKTLARKYEKEAEHAVLTVPSHFNSNQRKSIREAGEQAGLRVLQIVNEPTAAAICYCQEYPSEELRRILVYDLGGGTFDVSLVEAEGRRLTVVASDGLPFLGGIDFDLRLYEEAIARFREEHEGFEVAPNDWSLMHACEVAKRSFSKLGITRIPYTMAGKQIECDISRKIFNEICKDLFDQTIKLITKMIKNSDYEKDELDEIVLVGGASQMDQVHKLVKALFPGKVVRTVQHPELAVATGAAILAERLMNDDTEPSPDRLELMDVTAHSLGIALDDGEMSLMIPKGTPLPAERSEIFVNADDNDEMIVLEIMEGEESRVEKNARIAKLKIRVDRKKRNENEIEVRFCINRSGILEVTAMYTNTLRTASVIVQSNHLTSEERQRLIAEQRFRLQAAAGIQSSLPTKQPTTS